jgi:PAS domain S-box-containing protein
MFDSSPVATSLTTLPDGRYLDVNAAWLKLYEWSRDEVVGRTVAELNIWGDPARRPALFAELQQHGTVHDFEMELRTKSGRSVQLSWSGTRVVIGGESCLMGSALDITERKRAVSALVESQRFLHSTVNALASHIAILDEQGQIVEVNAAWQRFARENNCLRKHGVGANYLHVCDAAAGRFSEEATTVASGIRSIIAGRSDEYHLEYPCHSPLQKRWFIVRVTRFAGPGPVRAVVAHENITERKLAEVALRESQALYHSLVNQLPVGIFRKDAAGRYVLVNPGFCRLKGMQPEDFLGKLPSEVKASVPAKPDGSAAIIKYANDGEEHHRLIMQTGQSIEREEEYVFPNGRKQFVHATKLPVLNGDGTVIGSQGVLFDITERKLAAEEINLQLSALTAAANGIVITSRAGRIEWVNPAFTQLTGYTAAETVGHNPRVLKSGQHPPEFYAGMWQTVLAGKVWHGELVNRHKDGRLYSEHMTITPVRDAAGKITHFVAIKQDVTERRQLEDHLRQAQKMEAIGTLAGGIAHDFNNILAAMFGYGYLLQQDTEGNVAAQEDLAEILKAANRAKDLVQQILTFSRQREQKRQIVRLDSVVKEATKFLRASLPAQIKIEVALAEDAPAVLADPTQIYQVTMNLATNALHAMEGRPGQLTVRLDAFQPEAEFLRAHPEFQRIEYARLTVADTGHGMDAKTVARIFEPFFTTKPVGKGTGLGLAVVHGIVQSHDGLLTVASQVGQGTTFQLYFPAQTSTAELTEPVAGETATGQGQHILLLDDEPALTTSLRRLLERLNYQVTTSNSAREAVALVAANPAQFDLVITDMTMPEMNGLEVARQCHTLRPELPVILASGYSAAISATNLHEAGIGQLIEKPISMAVLAELVQRTLAKT